MIGALWLVWMALAAVTRAQGSGDLDSTSSTVTQPSTVDETYVALNATTSFDGPTEDLTFTPEMAAADESAYGEPNEDAGTTLAPPLASRYNGRIYAAMLCAMLGVAMLVVAISPRRRVVHSHHYELFEDAL